MQIGDVITIWESQEYPGDFRMNRFDLQGEDKEPKPWRVRVKRVSGYRLLDYQVIGFDFQQAIQICLKRKLPMKMEDIDTLNIKIKEKYEVEDISGVREALREMEGKGLVRWSADEGWSLVDE